MEIAGANNLAFIVHFAACIFMTGIIWIVQLILYPAFAYVDPAKYKQFHKLHSFRISLLVGPAMLVELATAMVLLFHAWGDWIWRFNLATIIVIWLCTVFISMPIHNTLSEGFELHKIRKLIRTNWPRTILWTLRLGMLCLVLRGAGHVL